MREMLHDSFMTTWTSGNHNERSPREPFREPEGLSAPVSSFVETIVGNMPNSLPNPIIHADQQRGRGTHCNR